MTYTATGSALSLTHSVSVRSVPPPTLNRSFYHVSTPYHQDRDFCIFVDYAIRNTAKNCGC
jgi:hypothetical protein